jgi:sulfate transport system permease protein
MVSSQNKKESQDPWWVRWFLIGVSVSFLTMLLLLPLIVIFQEAFSKGIAFYIRSL